MKSKIYLSLIAMIISAVGCHKEENNISQATSSGFSDTVVQKGSDEDTTYFSIRTSHQLNGTLNIDVSGWGIQETGLHIDASTSNSILSLRMIGMCGTIQMTTWVRPTFQVSVSTSEEQSLTEIHFSNGIITGTLDSLVISKR
ncbi:hypothetical protein FBQ87_03495 [Sphingobacteriales bacterium CHB3]|nr:hypothetical protein [Sphingobacteriales bacterium CHB3]